jgi:uncharacterized RDD family membrane protein YckC
MKCPKCQYISFDDGDKCRNCGYQFSLSVAVDDLDLPVDRSRADALPNTDSFDLPLFHDDGPDDDRPLVTVPPITRPPLSVRKASLNTPRPAARRDASHEPHLDLEPDDDQDFDALRRQLQPPESDAPIAAPAGDAITASAGARILSGVVDLGLLLAIDAAVLHLTLKFCGLTYAELSVLPVPPFAAFLLILNGGYLAAFTAAGGQSIGKMMGGIRVIPSDPEAWTDRVPLGQAVLRAAGYFLSALPLGLGFLPALIAADRRGFHDRLAHTRVVKA